MAICTPDQTAERGLREHTNTHINTPTCMHMDTLCTKSK